VQQQNAHTAARTDLHKRKDSNTLTMPALGSIYLHRFPTPTDFTAVTSRTKQYDPLVLQGVYKIRHVYTKYAIPPQY